MCPCSILLCLRLGGGGVVAAPAACRAALALCAFVRVCVESMCSCVFVAWASVLITCAASPLRCCRTLSVTVLWSAPFTDATLRGEWAFESAVVSTSTALLIVLAALWHVGHHGA
jgi:hypothetical protein